MGVAQMGRVYHHHATDTPDYEHRPALELVQSIRTKEERITELLDELEGMLENANG